MDLLDRFLGHDAWTTRQLLLRCRGLREDEFDRRWDGGRRSLRATFDHVIRNVEIWGDLLSGGEGRAREEVSVEGLLDRLEVSYAHFASVARDLAKRNAWDETWTDTLEAPPCIRTFGGTVAHVVTHSMHHRAQILDMLRRLDVPDLPEGDVLSWESHSRERSPWEGR